MIATRAAEVSLPLFVAPVLPRDQLETLRSVTVSVYDWELGNQIEETLIINGIRKINSTFVILESQSGKSLHIKNGKAHLAYSKIPSAVQAMTAMSELDIPGNSSERAVTIFNANVCAGDSQCSSFTVDDSAEGLIDLAVSELQNIGVNTSKLYLGSRKRSNSSDNSTRRALASWNEQHGHTWQEMISSDWSSAQTKMLFQIQEQ